MSLSLPWRRCRLRPAPLLAAAAAALACLAATAQTGLSIDQAVALAAGASRLVAASEAQARATRELAVAAGRLPDPVLKLGLNDLPINGPDRWSLTRDADTQRSIGVMQEFTRADKRAARSERAGHEVGLAEAARRQTVAELQRDTALAWLDRSFQESMREQLQQQVDHALLQVQAAETLYRNGRGARAEVYAARGEVEALRDRIDEVEREIEVATTRLARWIGDAARQPLAARPALQRPAWAADAPAAPLDRHPAVAAQRQQEAAAESEARLAAANRRADWSVELMYSQRGPAYSNMVSINLSVPLQWDQKNRQDRELAAREALVEQARARREDAERATRAELSAWLQQWRSHEQRLRRHDQALLPLAQQRSAAALSAYAAGSGALTAVLEARRDALQVHLERLRIELDLARIWAQLAFLMPQDGAMTPGTTP
ncbi:MAG TPA: TolC family protein [Methylibium sp.]|nr:TolC family protein [Methylibium sp.]